MKAKTQTVLKTVFLVLVVVCVIAVSRSEKYGEIPLMLLGVSQTVKVDNLATSQQKKSEKLESDAEGVSQW
jgi:hypothetical protein